MKHPTAANVRQLYLDYFARHGHTLVKSGPLIPAGDPTLMFTNAGMVPFKDVFVGAETRPYKRATTCQKCMRVSGKHNDLEEVGRTARHHTFFEMLGNFSFGDYFKEQAIELAWRFVVDELQLPKDRLWITVFGGAEGVPADAEARTLWKRISGVADGRIVDLGMKDNFWAMGDTGPCGPCTEIHFDQGSGEATLADFDSGRVMEIWNNVFMQFDRQKSGELRPLPAPSVDTGMGLERVVALVNGADSNYHTDTFLPILDTVAAACGKPYRRSASEDDVSMRVIADHARATAFLVAEGVQPANEGRGYVMRRLMRRAIRHGRRLGFTDLFFYRACDTVVRCMGTVYPELQDAASLIEKVAQVEEEGFRRTLDTGLRILGEALTHAKSGGNATLPGDVVFKLYDTYGFPKDLTDVIAHEAGMGLDEAGFAAAMTAQKERSRGAEVGHAAVAAVYKEVASQLGPIPFMGYPHEDEPLEARPGRWKVQQEGERSYLFAEVQVAALLHDGARVDSLAGAGEVVLSPTPLYGESGGQAGDAGLILGEGLHRAVRDTQKPVENLTVSRLDAGEGTLRVGDTVWAGYDVTMRRATRAHHSATHLLHGALRQVLGEHVKQAGSFVDAHHLRFDYSHFAAPTQAELQAVEDDANRRIAAKSSAVVQELSYEEARQKGAIALFGEKYGDRVRVITLGESVELCGGTHAKNTGDIDLLLITAESAVQSGVRRIEAEVAEAARGRTQRLQAQLQAAAAILDGGAPAAAGDEPDPVLQALHKARQHLSTLHATIRAAGGTPVAPDLTASVPPLPERFGLAEARARRDAWQGLVQLLNARAADADAIVARFGGGLPLLTAVARLLLANRDNERRVEETRRGQRSELADELLSGAQQMGSVRVVAAKVDGFETAALRELADRLRDKLGSGVVCLGTVDGPKVGLLVAVSRDLIDRVQAGALIRELAPLIGGRGGGKPELAQAGGSDAAGLTGVFARLTELVGAKFI